MSAYQDALISIICPVYNAEKTVSKMIESVISQDYKNLQLIIADDKSSDSTVETVERYAEKDSRILLIKNKENVGPGPSKNNAIQYAEGEFITFIDADDWIEKGAYSALMSEQRSSEADVVVMGYIQDYLEKSGEIKYSVEVLPPKLSGDETAAQVFTLLDFHKIYSFCWTKLIKASLIKENGIEFPPIMHSEDFFFNMSLLPYVNKTATVTKAFYHYIKPASVTLTSSDYIPGYYELSNKRYEASKAYCVSQNSFEGESRLLIANTHIKHLSMCLIYNCSQKSGMNHKKRISFIKEMLKNPNTAEALKYSSGVSCSSKIMNTFFKTQSPFILAFFARTMWILRQKFSFLFDKLK